MGIALTLYGQEDSAEVVIEQLLGDKDPILRYGGVYAIAMAFAGTASNWAIRKLLYVAVSDVSPDVRRGAVTALGFVLVRRPESVPKMVALLAESYNPHVRYGSAMAVGIACAGTGQKSAIDLLLILAKDRVDFVRQGALISLALVLQQINVTQEPSVKVVREMFEKVTKDKHEDLLAKFGAIIATGIIDAGGRNTVVKLSNRFGHRNMNGIVGMAMFCQYWSWFPLLHFFSLASMPTAIIGLNADLQMPAFTFTSNSKPSTFAYPEPMKAPEKKDVAKLPTAVLSTTAKAKARQEKKEKEGGAAAATTSTASAISSPMTTTASATIPTSASTNDVEMKEKDADTSGASPATGSASQKDATATGAAATAAAAASTAAVAAPEPTSEKKQNPSRVTLLQINQIVFDAECKYQPISTRGRSFGITMVFNTNPDEKEEIIASSVPASTAPGAVADVPLPQEFDFVE
jgi:26S proteasome regulatory subunit N2